MQKKINIQNKKAQFEYLLISNYNAGIVLSGTEIKSIRDGKASIKEAFCQFNEKNELFIVGMYVLRIWSNAIYGGKEGKFYKPPLDGFGCPRCLEGYQPQIETCADCGEKIMQFKETPSSETFKKYHT